MKKRQIKICIFISMTLFLLFNTVCFADVDEEKVVAEEAALKEIVDGLTIQGYQMNIGTKDEPVCIDQKYYIMYSSEYFTEDGKVTIGDAKYDCYFAFESENASLNKITESVQYVDQVGYSSKISIDGVAAEAIEENYNEKLADGKLVCYLVSGDKVITKYSVTDEELKEKLKIDTTDKDKMITQTPDEKTNPWEAGWDVLVHGDFSTLGSLLTESIVDMFLPCGDGFLHMMAKALGEVVTIDKIVFGDVKKLSIDFFDSGDTDTSSKIVPLKNTLSKVISDWYAFFLKVAILFYLVLLVYMGLRIILASTGEKKAEYKTRLVAWTMGVAMLMFFPYVMKYTILVNKGLCIWIGEAVKEGTGSKSSTAGFNIADYEISEIYSSYGKNEFVAYALGYDSISALGDASAGGNDIFGNNVMLRIRLSAKTSYSLPLTVVYLILLGETFTLIIMYYKRVFMLAFLITIFPLAAMFYTLNKTRRYETKQFWNMV